jgi:hypothetical protein
MTPFKENFGDRIDRYFLTMFLMAGGWSFGRTLGGVICYFGSWPYHEPTKTIATVGGLLMAIYVRPKPKIPTGADS